MQLLFRFIEDGQKLLLTFTIFIIKLCDLFLSFILNCPGLQQRAYSAHCALLNDSIFFFAKLNR